ncbi:AAA family ATPase [Clostridium sp. VAP41]|uniref:AAA family ATPase n=1 Tax=Clostridium sp. VAP41 TaxID=2949979 RepID=UPI00207971BD|nr:AAA family ATPase [Clostridium sp. VAP41]
MILGVFINGYKSYKKSYYIPISEKVEDKYSVYIGNNGVGKSAIFESLDVFFNQREWNINKGATKNDIYISPVFLINKVDFKERLINNKYYSESQIESNNETIIKIEELSSYIYNTLETDIQGATKRDHIIRFFETVAKLNSEEIKSSYYIVFLGVDVNSKPTFKPMENYILSKIFNGKRNYMEKFLNQLKELVAQYYAYLYISVEQSIDDILKVEAKQMQILMDKNVLEEIDKVLDTKVKINERNKTILKFLNEHLDIFMTSVNTSIQTISKNYSYNSQAFIKKILLHQILGIRF